MPRSENLTGALLMMASMAAFTLNDTLMKTMAGDVPLFQLLFLRGCYTVVFVGVMAWVMGATKARPSGKDALLILLRVGGEIGAAYFFFWALFNMPLANVSAILQASPLVITLTAATIFHEPLGWRRFTAIVIGFLGVLLIVRPGTNDFTVYSLYALIAVCFVTLRDLATRKISRQTHSMFVTFATALAVTVFFGFLTWGEDWSPMDPRQHWTTLVTSIFVLGGYVFSIMVMRVGEISFTAPFRYTGLLWALLLGWVAFQEWPEPLTLIGAAIVVASGLFMLYREARLGILQRRGRITTGRPR